MLYQTVSKWGPFEFLISSPGLSYLLFSFIFFNFSCIPSSRLYPHSSMNNKPIMQTTHLLYLSCTVQTLCLFPDYTLILSPFLLLLGTYSILNLDLAFLAGKLVKNRRSERSKIITLFFASSCEVN